MSERTIRAALDYLIRAFKETGLDEPEVIMLKDARNAGLLELLLMEEIGPLVAPARPAAHDPHFGEMRYRGLTIRWPVK